MSNSTFRAAMSVGSRRAKLGQCALLAWIAASNGNISEKAHQKLREFTTSEDDSILNLALTLIQSPSADDISLACQSAEELPISQRQKFLVQAISVAVADGKLSIAANHILRLLSDLLELNLGDIYLQCTKQPLPVPGDPSSLQWWQRTQKSKTADGKTNRKKRRKRGMTQDEALSILGLDQDADSETIARTFRRLATIHHPDRFSQSDEETQRSAAKEFAKINEAHDTLAQS